MKREKYVPIIDVEEEQERYAKVSIEKDIPHPNMLEYYSE